MVVVLVEVVRKAYLASIVPVIVNAILNEHQLIVDIVAFVAGGDFPRSRLGEKQRGKILASWVTRKLRTIAQFTIRDPEAAEGGMSSVPEDHRASSVRGSSIRDSVLPGQYGNGAASLSHEPIYETAAMQPETRPDTSLPEGVAEMPAYESSIMESPPFEHPPARGNGNDQDTTPTAQKGFALPVPDLGSDDYFNQPDSSMHDPEATPQPHAVQHFEYDSAAAPQVLINDNEPIGQAVTGNGDASAAHSDWFAGYQNGGQNGGQRQSYMPYRPS